MPKGWHIPTNISEAGHAIQPPIPEGSIHPNHNYVTCLSNGDGSCRQNTGTSHLYPDQFKEFMSRCTSGGDPSQVKVISVIWDGYNSNDYWCYYTYDWYSHCYHTKIPQYTGLGYPSNRYQSNQNAERNRVFLWLRDDIPDMPPPSPPPLSP